MNIKDWKHWAFMAAGVLLIVAVASRIGFVRSLVFGMPATTTPAPAPTS